MPPSSWNASPQSSRAGTLSLVEMSPAVGPWLQGLLFLAGHLRASSLPPRESCDLL